MKFVAVMIFLMASPVYSQDYFVCRDYHNKLEGFQRAIDFVRDYQSRHYDYDGYYRLHFVPLVSDMIKEKMKMYREIDYLNCWWGR